MNPAATASPSARGWRGFITGFLEHLRRDSALGVLPFEFTADSSKIGGAGVRLVVAKADRRFSYRQMILIQRLIRPATNYQAG